MKRLLRITAFCVIGCCVLFAVGLLAINLFIQSRGVQQEIRDSVSESLGVPITVFRITFTPWSGLNFDDVSIPNQDSETPLLKASNLRLSFDYGALFRRKIIIREIRLQHLDIVVPAGGNNEEKAGPKTLRDPEVHTETSPKAAESPLPEPARKTTLKETLAQKFWIEIQRFTVRDGAVTIVRPDGSILGTLRNLECNLRFQHGEYIGDVRADSANVGETIQLQDLSSGVDFHSGLLTLNVIDATLSDGEVQGSFHVDLSQAAFPYGLNLKVDDVDMNQMMEHTGGLLEHAHGLLSGDITLAGNARDAATTAGTGHLSVQNAYIEQYPLLQELGRWTQIDELQKLDLEEAASNFRIVNSDIHIDALNLISKNCQVEIHGSVIRGERLQLQGRLMIDQFLSQKIPNELGENFTVANDGKRYLDFNISGSPLRPQTDLFERIIGDQRKLFQRLLRGHSNAPHPSPTETTDSANG